MPVDQLADAMQTASEACAAADVPSLSAIMAAMQHIGDESFDQKFANALKLGTTESPTSIGNTPFDQALDEINKIFEQSFLRDPHAKQRKTNRIGSLLWNIANETMSDPIYEDDQKYFQHWLQITEKLDAVLNNLGEETSPEFTPVKHALQEYIAETRGIITAANKLNTLTFKNRQETFKKINRVISCLLFATLALTVIGICAGILYGTLFLTAPILATPLASALYTVVPAAAGAVYGLCSLAATKMLQEIRGEEKKIIQGAPMAFKGVDANSTTSDAIDTAVKNGTNRLEKLKKAIADLRATRDQKAEARSKP